MMTRNSIYALLLATTTVSAQNTAGLHQLRANDQVKKQIVELTTPLETGQDVVWDLSGLEDMEVFHNVNYSEVTGNEDLIAATESSTRFYYRQTADSLLRTGYENNLTRVDYDRPQLLLHTPLVYGERMEGLFHGTATYCERLYLRLFGSYTTEVDGTGCLLLPSGDTLRHVSRIHTTEIRAEQLYPHITTEKELKAYTDSIATYTSDSIIAVMQDGRQLIQTDTYRWYADGYRYPIFETITIGLKDNDLCYGTALYCGPDEQELLEDEDNRQLRQLLAEIDRQAASRQNMPENDDNSPIKNMSVSVSGQTIMVTYDLAQDATVKVLVCDIMGIVYRQQSQTGQTGDNYQMSIACDGLQHGQYVLYLNVNGQVKSTAICL